MSEIISKDALINFSFGVEEFMIEGIGMVKIRALTRAEALSVRGVEMPFAVMEQTLIAYAFVEPKLTIEDAKRIQESTPAGLLEPVTDRIAKMSGMKADKPKEMMKTFRE